MTDLAIHVTTRLERLSPRARRGWSAAALAGLAALSLGVAASLHGDPVELESVSAGSGTVAALLDRAADAGAALEGVEAYYEAEIAPVERVLRRYSDDPALTRRVALALTREANVVGLEPRILLAVLLVENPWLDPEARSPVGAVGLMQVMPLHRGHWGCAGPLEDVETNICYGARIFASYYRATGGDVDRALLRYNGCVRGTNTPDCRRYPYHVYARAGYAAMLEWLDPVGPRAAAP